MTTMTTVTGHGSGHGTVTATGHRERPVFMRVVTVVTAAPRLVSTGARIGPPCRDRAMTGPVTTVARTTGARHSRPEAVQ